MNLEIRSIKNASLESSLHIVIYFKDKSSHKFNTKNDFIWSIDRGIMYMLYQQSTEHT